MSSFLNLLLWDLKRSRNLVPQLSSYFITKNVSTISPVCGCVKFYSTHISDKSVGIYNEFESIPNDVGRRRSLKLVIKEKRRRLALSHQVLRRKKDILFNKLNAAKTKIAGNVEQIIERENIWTIPNILCVSRIIVCPYLGYLILDSNYSYACCLLIIAGFTDLLDGYIARNFKAQSSKLGSFLDPLADKILVGTVFLTLTYAGIVPALLTSVIVVRDVALATAGFYIRYRSLPPPKTLSRYFDPSHATAQLAPTFISKVNTFVQLSTIFCTLSAPVFGYLDHPYMFYLWCLTGATTVLSAGSYLFSSNTYKLLKKPNVVK